MGRLVRIPSDFEGSTDVGINAAHPRAPHILPPVTAVIAFLRNLSTDAGMVDANDCPRIGAMIG
ncbi:hypothetical protein [Sphingomonas solaris]|uniref:Uncharacterized protein n=1 Tax=Alterirhizorhabdus solaris TaxID=2529389 RepID=A0A558R9R1_9SPHN|nr:hypothetical protein [Sphingomonas solaris]TVV76115.1 hypothetical protein FOY91_05060 [Sphingomonas solaris]